MLGGLEGLISVARGDTPADLILANARIINTFNGGIETGNVAVYGGKIAGIGDYRQGKTTIDLKGRYLAPGLIDGHTHLESSMLSVAQYARAVVPRGTSAIVTDLHEIANVSGLEGMKYIMDSSRGLPLEVFLMAPSCVPATHLETSGASLGPTEIRKVLRWRDCIGLGEVMNFPGVIGGAPDVLEKISSTGSKTVDGHAPGVSGKNLNAYISAGIHSDHESVALAEAHEKLARGMYVMIREGSSEKNLDALLPLVTDSTWNRCFFVVDDRSCADLLRDGDIDAVVRKAISRGIHPVRAIQMATINTASYFRLNGLGAVAPGFFANMIVLDDLGKLDINMVFYRGRLVAEDGKPLFSVPLGASGLTNTMNVKAFGIEALRIPARGDAMPVINIIPGQIVTGRTDEKVKISGGLVTADTARDILKLAVIERHRATGNIGVGLVRGLGLKKGAMASSIAHDSHNIVVAGVNDEDMFAAVKEIERMNGGLAVVADGKVAGSLALPIAGLLSDEPLETVAAKVEMLERLVRELGGALSSPFGALSFLALPVIPALRLTDRGLVDVMQFKIIG